MFPLKTNSFYSFPYSILNCSNLVTTCSIPNVFGNPSKQISSIINTATIFLKTKNLQTINTSSNNLVTIFNTHLQFKDRTRSNLHDGS